MVIIAERLGMCDFCQIVAAEDYYEGMHLCDVCYRETLRLEACEDDDVAGN